MAAAVAYVIGCLHDVCQYVFKWKKQAYRNENGCGCNTKSKDSSPTLAEVAAASQPSFNLQTADHEEDIQDPRYRHELELSEGELPVPAPPPPTRNTSDNGLLEHGNVSPLAKDGEKLKSLVSRLSGGDLAEADEDTKLRVEKGDVSFARSSEEKDTGKPRKIYTMSSNSPSSTGQTSSWVNVEENDGKDSAKTDSGPGASWENVPSPSHAPDATEDKPFSPGLNPFADSFVPTFPAVVPQGSDSLRQTADGNRDPPVPDEILARAPLLADEDSQDVTDTKESVTETFDDDEDVEVLSESDDSQVGDMSLPDEEEEEETEDNKEEPITDEEALSILSDLTDDCSSITLRQARALVKLLHTVNYRLLKRVLAVVGNAAAFTPNQEELRKAGCLQQLVRMLKGHNMATKIGTRVAYPGVVTGVCSSVNNLSMNATNQEELKESIPALIDFITSPKSPENVQLSALQALTNLSVLSEYHEPYTKIVQMLYGYLETGNGSVQLQSLKVLVNLSCNPEMVPHLLAAKAPKCVLELLKPDTDINLLIRWTTLLGNMMHTAKEQGITYSSLPTDYKAASPETMYSAIYGVKESMHFRSKVFVLSKHENEDVRYHAARVYSSLV